VVSDVDSRRDSPHWSRLTTVPNLADEIVRGNVAPEYEKVAAVFRGFFDKHWDIASAVAVYRGGQPVVRLTGGSHAVTSGDAVPYDDTTIQLVASTTKFVDHACHAD
jgi:hypothetical protein